jgi:hypothetical protein
LQIRRFGEEREDLFERQRKFEFGFEEMFHFRAVCRSFVTI